MYIEVAFEFVAFAFEMTVTTMLLWGAFDLFFRLIFTIFHKSTRMHTEDVMCEIKCMRKIHGNSFNWKELRTNEPSGNVMKLILAHAEVVLPLDVARSLRLTGALGAKAFILREVKYAASVK